MRSLRELATASVRYLRELAATVELAADSVIQAASLVTRIVGATTRLVRGLVRLLGVLLAGARQIAVDLVHLAHVFGRLRAVFSPASRRRYRQQFRRERRIAERELVRYAREMAMADAELQREHRRRAQPPPPPRPLPADPPRRRQDSDGYPSSSSPSGSGDGTPGSSGSSSGSHFFWALDRIDD